jgi:hypothetical protein
VSEAVATLPWVEAGSIKVERRTTQVRFTVKDRNQFDIEKLKQVIEAAGYDGTKLLTGPTEN